MKIMKNPQKASKSEKNSPQMEIETMPPKQRLSFDSQDGIVGHVARVRFLSGNIVFSLFKAFCGFFMISIKNPRFFSHIFTFSSKF